MSSQLARGEALRQRGDGPGLAALGALVKGLVTLVQRPLTEQCVLDAASELGAVDRRLRHGVLQASTELGDLWIGCPPEVPAIVRLATSYYPDEADISSLPYVATRAGINVEFERIRRGVRRALGPERRCGVYRAELGERDFHWARWHSEGATTYLLQDHFDRDLSPDLSVWILPVADLLREPPILPMVQALLDEARRRPVITPPKLPMRRRASARRTA